MGRQADLRIDLQAELEELLGSEEVYFQPPASLKMNYPAIRYSRNRITSTNANNGVYRIETQYTITLITRDPDSELVEKLAHFHNSRHDRHYEADGLNHDVFTLFTI